MVFYKIIPTYYLSQEMAPWERFINISHTRKLPLTKDIKKSHQLTGPMSAKSNLLLHINLVTSKRGIWICVFDKPYTISYPWLRNWCNACRTEGNAYITISKVFFYVDGLRWDCSYSNALAMELLQSSFNSCILPWYHDLGNCNVNGIIW